MNYYVLRITLILFAQIIVHFSLGQEKRLALVIGNNNYVKSPLKNAVNDALLIESTLQQLDFDIILDTNVTTKGRFLSVVQRFGMMRPEYDVGFVFYAGHGIEVDGENYLLATHETYNTEFDVQDNGIKVDKIVRYLTRRTNEVNIIVLDACRDNPFERKWKGATRGGGNSGVARLPTPTGTLIAYSTESGSTAVDGVDDHSFYTESLCRNMLLKDVSLDQVFRNVRAEVLQSSNGTQRPIEFSQLTGSTYYLVPSDLSIKINHVDSLIDACEYQLASEFLGQILYAQPNCREALIRRGDIFSKTKRGYTGEDYFQILEFNPRDIQALNRIARFSLQRENLSQAFMYLFDSHEIDSTSAETYALLAQCSMKQADHEDAVKFAQRACSYAPENLENKSILAWSYLYQGDFTKTDSLIQVILQRNKWHIDANYLKSNISLIRGEIPSSTLIESPQISNLLEIYKHYIEENSLRQASETKLRMGDLFYDHGYSSKEYEYAIDAYKRAFDLDPQFRLQHESVLCRAYIDMENFQDAWRMIERLTSNFPDNSTVKRLTAYYHFMLDEDLEALSKIATLLEDNPCDIELLRWQAQSYITLLLTGGSSDYSSNAANSYLRRIQCTTDLTKKAEIMTEILDWCSSFDDSLFVETLNHLDLIDPELLSYRAIILSRFYYLSQEYSIGKSYALKAADIGYNLGEAFFWAGENALESGQYEEARHYFNKSLKNDYQNECWARSGLLHCKLFLNESFERNSYELEILACDSINKSSFALEISQHLIDDKLYEEALFWINESIRFDPIDPYAHRQRAEIHVHIDQYYSAFSDYSASISLSRDAEEKSNYLFSRARFRSDKIGDHLGAIEDMMQSLKLHPNDSLLIWNVIGNYYERIGDSRSAQHYYTTVNNVCMSTPEDNVFDLNICSTASFDLALLHLSLGEIKKARNLIKYALAVSDENMELSLMNHLISHYVNDKRIVTNNDYVKLKSRLEQESMEPLDYGWEYFLDAIAILTEKKGWIFDNINFENIFKVTNILDCPQISKVITIINGTLKEEVLCTIPSSLTSSNILDRKRLLNLIKYQIDTGQFDHEEYRVLEKDVPELIDWKIYFLLAEYFKDINPQLSKEYIVKSRLELQIDKGTDVRGEYLSRILETIFPTDLHIAYAEWCADNGYLGLASLELENARTSLQNLFYWQQADPIQQIEKLTEQLK